MAEVVIMARIKRVGLKIRVSIGRAKTSVETTGNVDLTRAREISISKIRLISSKKRNLNRTNRLEHLKSSRKLPRLKSQMSRKFEFDMLI